jgi:hypothetical protein
VTVDRRAFADTTEGKISRRYREHRAAAVLLRAARRVTRGARARARWRPALTALTAYSGAARAWTARVAIAARARHTAAWSARAWTARAASFSVAASPPRVARRCRASAVAAGGASRRAASALRCAARVLARRAARHESSRVPTKPQGSPAQHAPARPTSAAARRPSTTLDTGSAGAAARARCLLVDAEAAELVAAASDG